MDLPSSLRAPQKRQPDTSTEEELELLRKIITERDKKIFRLEKENEELRRELETFKQNQMIQPAGHQSESFEIKISYIDHKEYVFRGNLPTEEELRTIASENNPEFRSSVHLEINNSIREEQMHELMNLWTSYIQASTLFKLTAVNTDNFSLQVWKYIFSILNVSEYFDLTIKVNEALDIESLCQLLESFTRYNYDEVVPKIYLEIKIASLDSKIRVAPYKNFLKSRYPKIIDEIYDLRDGFCIISYPSKTVEACIGIQEIEPLSKNLSVILKYKVPDNISKYISQTKIVEFLEVPHGKILEEIFQSNISTFDGILILTAPKDAMISIFEVLRKFKSLSNLSIKVSEEHAELLYKAIKDLPLVLLVTKMLALPQEEFATIPALTAFNSKIESLESLELKTAELMNKGLIKLQNLNSLNFTLNDKIIMDDLGIKKLYVILKRLTMLQYFNLHLILDDTTDQGMKTLAETILEFKDLKYLELEFLTNNKNSKITSTGITPLMKSIGSCSLLKFIYVTIKIPSFDDNNLLELSKSLSGCADLCAVILSTHNSQTITKKGLRNLVDGVKNLQSLKRVQFYFHACPLIDDSETKNMISVLKERRQMQEICICYQECRLAKIKTYLLTPETDLYF